MQKNSRNWPRRLAGDRALKNCEKGGGRWPMVGGYKGWYRGLKLQVTYKLNTMSHHLPPELLDVWNHVYANNAEMFAANLSRSRSICRSTQYTILYRLTSLRLNHLLINSTGDRLYPVYLKRIIRVNDFSMCPFWIQKFLPECKALEEALKLIVLIGDKSHTYDCNCSVCGRHPAPDMENIPLLKQALKHPKWSVSYSPSRRWKRTPLSWSRRWKRKGRKLWRPLLAFGSRRNAG